MFKERQSGVLLPLSAVNGEFAVGVMGCEVEEFIKKIKEMGFSYWQVLPVGTTDDMNSPYCSQSAFAGNYIYIDPRSLEKKGLVTREQCESNRYSGSHYTCDYTFALEKRLELLHIAFSNTDAAYRKKVADFCEKYPFLSDFAFYMALKEKNQYAAWWQWPEKLRDFDKAKTCRGEYSEEIEFWQFVQFEFYSDWFELKSFANENGVKILGDMPIYVSLDSADVWSNRSLFKLDDKTLKPKKVAGVPPDYFSENGQKWGNPIYDWAKMKKTGYSWWIQRLKFALEIYDTVRIDHFRAFASYWEVEADAETAKVGEWQKGPGMALFRAIGREIENPSIIAEDLGTFGEDVVKLLEDTEFPGMRVIQFGFDPCGDSTHLPHNYERNCVAYVGTHDNNTILGWLFEASPDEREFALAYCGFENGDWGEGGYHSPSCRKVTEAVWKSSAGLAMIAFQDMCGFGNDARINTPGRAENNWLYRAGKDAMDCLDKEYFKKINRLFRRG